MDDYLLSKLVQGGLKEPRCEKCDNYHWLGQPMPLRVFFIDGDKANHDFNNVKVLCPNCYEAFGVEPK